MRIISLGQLRTNTWLAKMNNVQYFLSDSICVIAIDKGGNYESVKSLERRSCAGHFGFIHGAVDRQRLTHARSRRSSLWPAIGQRLRLVARV